MHKHPLLLPAVLLVVLPAAALAGKKVTAGDQTLQISGSLAPAKASKPKKPQGVTLHLKVDYESLNAGAQVKESTKDVILDLPAGTTIHTDAAAQCKYSDLNANGPDACPAGSQVGQGSATADARPAVADPVQATVTLFNGLDDTNPDGTPRDPATPALLLYAKTTLGVNTALPFDISASRLELDYAPPQPGATQLFHLQKVDVTLPKGGKKPYVTAPAGCKKRWLLSMTIDNFDGPSVTATHAVKCHK